MEKTKSNPKEDQQQPPVSPQIIAVNKHLQEYKANGKKIAEEKLKKGESVLPDYKELRKIFSIDGLLGSYILENTPNPAKHKVTEIKNVRVRPIYSVKDNDEEDELVNGYWIEPQKGSGDKHILYMHGGGWCMGNYGAYERFMSYLANEANANIFFVDYPLAPENRFPSGLKNLVAAYRYLLEQKKINAQNIFFAGDSAGGNLVLTVTLAIKPSKIPLPKGIISLSPITNISSQSPSYKRNEKQDALVSEGILHWLSQLYLGDLSSALKHSPLVSPLLSNDLKGFPPVQFWVTDEVLEDETLSMAERLRFNGNTVEVFDWHGLHHVWPVMAPSSPESLKTMAQMKRFMDDLLK